MYEIRASEIGSCLRAQIARRMGFPESAPPPAFTEPEGFFERGLQHEDDCLAKMMAEGWDIYDQQAEVRVDTDVNEFTIVGHIDAMGITPEGWSKIPEFVVEAKAPGAWAEFEKAYRTGTWTPLTLRYAWQTSVYMIATGSECVVVCLDGDTLKAFVIEEPIHTLGELYARAEKIVGATGLVPCTQNDYPCPYWPLHEEPPAEEDAEVDKVGAALIATQKMMNTLKNRETVLRAEMREVMGDRTEITTELVKVTISDVKGRTTYDFEAMARDGIDLEPYKSVGEAHTQLRVTERKKA